MPIDLPPGWKVEYKSLDGGMKPGDQVVMKIIDPNGQVREDVSLLNVWDVHKRESGRNAY